MAVTSYPRRNSSRRIRFVVSVTLCLRASPNFRFGWGIQLDFSSHDLLASADKVLCILTTSYSTCKSEASHIAKNRSGLHISQPGGVEFIAGNAGVMTGIRCCLALGLSSMARGSNLQPRCLSARLVFGFQGWQGCKIGLLDYVHGLVHPAF